MRGIKIVKLVLILVFYTVSRYLSKLCTKQKSYSPITTTARSDVAPNNWEAATGPHEQLSRGPLAAHTARVFEERPGKSREDRNHRDGDTSPQIPARTRERFVRKARLFGNIVSYNWKTIKRYFWNKLRLVRSFILFCEDDKNCVICI